MFEHKPFAVLADHLTRAGIAVLRYDDRGFGASTGDFSAATTADFATDARAAVAYLKTRKEIDGAAIGLVGHSEGGLIGPLAAVDNPDVAYLVLLAGPGTGMIDLLIAQQRLIGVTIGASEEDLDVAVPVLRAVFEAVAATDSREEAEAAIEALLTPEAIKKLGAPVEQKPMIVRSLSGDWFRYLLAYDPAEALRKIRIPVLAVNGSLDRQVAPDENLAAIESALSGNDDVTVVKLDGLNHMFQTAKTGAMGEYADLEETMSPVLLDLVSDWIGARFSPAP